MTLNKRYKIQLYKWPVTTKSYVWYKYVCIVPNGTNLLGRNKTSKYPQSPNPPNPVRKFSLSSSQSRSVYVGLVLAGGNLSGELRDCFLGPVWSQYPLLDIPKVAGETYKSPRPTMQTVCQTPSPILGVTPR